MKLVKTRKILKNIIKNHNQCIGNGCIEAEYEIMQLIKQTGVDYLKQIAESNKDEELGTYDFDGIAETVLKEINQ